MPTCMSNLLALVLLAVAPAAASVTCTTPAFAGQSSLASIRQDDARCFQQKLAFLGQSSLASIRQDDARCFQPDPQLNLVHCAAASSQMSGASLLQIRGKGMVSKNHHDHVKIGKQERVQKIKMGLQEVASALGLSEAGGIQSFAPHAPHAGRSDSIPVPYEVNKSVGKGLGIFVTKPVKKGQMTWRFRPKAHVKILKQDLPALHALLKAAHPTVAKWFLRWTYPAAGSLYFEMDDGRFTNDAPGKKANTKDVGWKQYASRDIEAGEELTEDYRKQGELDVPEQFRFLYDEFDPGNDHL